MQLVCTATIFRLWVEIHTKCIPTVLCWLRTPSAPSLSVPERPQIPDREPLFAARRFFVKLFSVQRCKAGQKTTLVLSVCKKQTKKVFSGNSKTQSKHPSSSESLQIIRVKQEKKKKKDPSPLQPSNCAHAPSKPPLKGQALAIPLA